MSLPISKIDPQDNPDREIYYIDISSVDNIRHVIGSVKQYRLTDAPSRARQIVHAGDVLFATVRPYLRNIACVPSDYDEQIASTGFSVLRPAKGISPDFLFYKAISNDFVDALSEVQYGVSYPAVKDDQVRDQPLWLPPTDEQLRVVAKIEELFSELDKGGESLRQARRQLALYRQSVLKHAFEGKLTAQWRIENKDMIEMPEQLLARIEQERKTCYEQHLQEWKAAVKIWEDCGNKGNRPTKPRPANAPSPVDQKDQELLFDIPNGWAWVPLGQLFSVSPQNGVYKPVSEYGSGTRIIRIGDFYNGKLIPRTKFKRLRLNNEEIDKYKLRNSDLIINRVNSIEHLGKCALISNLNESTVFESNVMRCRVIDNVISKKYVSTYLTSDEGLKRLRENAKHAVNQASINQTDVGNTSVPIPSIEEQHLIVQRVEQQLSQADSLMSQVESHIDEAEVLRQSILSRAFSGRLVPQDPNDEPASVVLDRIKAERGQRANSGMDRRRVRKKRATA
ncbi:MAG: restriction endonuclease subunit S [Bryobacterales bacterium]|nr:restriction endonuclease subunit S [Bryobacterales bacterium]